MQGRTGGRSAARGQGIVRADDRNEEMGMILAKPENIEAFTARGWWGTSTIDDLFRARVSERGDAEAVIDPINRPAVYGGHPRRLSWNALADEVARMAGVLHGLGLRKDDVVLSQLPNSVEQYVAYLACARLGIIVTPVPAQYREHEIRFVVGQAQAKAAICTARIGSFAHAPMMLGLRAQCDGLRHVLCFGEAVPAGAIELDRALAECTGTDIAAAEACAQAAGITANDIFSLTWTSGTESNPKGVPRSANDWRIFGQAVVAAPQLTAGQRSLNPFPMVNHAGISSAFMAWLEAGLTIVQHHPFDLGVYLEQIRTEVIEYSVAPPAILNMLLQQPQLLEGIRFDKLRYLGSGSAPLSQWMISEFDRRFGVKVHNLFGSSEGMCLPGTDRDIPDPALRAAYFPRVGVQGFEWDAPCAAIMETRLVDPATEQEITAPRRARRDAGPGADGHQRILACSGADGQVLRCAGLLQDGRHVRDRRRAQSVLQVFRPFQGSGDPRRHEHLARRDRVAAAGPSQGARGIGHRLAGCAAGRVGVCLRGTQGGRDGDAGGAGGLSAR
jgi:acyl-CoA synthetase (AMP-forming)/AMP-acid ligase II